ncbi:MAG: sigma 54-interacting transcriptional regulator [Firmicutes bacterium]|nr:sigma 54-interacting transcriptional regulator [Bacillota bacterium]
MGHIAVVAPDNDLASLCEDVARSLDAGQTPVRVVVGSLRSGLDVARGEGASGAEVIVSRGGTALVIRENLPVPVVEVTVTAIDLLYTLNDAWDFARNVVVMGFRNVIDSLEGIDSVLSERVRVPLHRIAISDQDDIPRKITEAIRRYTREGLVFVGGSLIVDAARQSGCRAVQLRSGRESVARALRDATTLVQAVRSENERANLLKTILDSISDGVLAADSSGNITLFNRAAESILGVKAVNVVGRKVSQSIPESWFHLSVESHRPDIGSVKKVGDKTIVLNRLPLVVDRRTIGAVATFQNATQLQRLEEIVRKKLAGGGLVPKYSFDDIVAMSGKMRETVSLAARFGATERTVLVVGETGTGKELFAHAMHRVSPCRFGPFVSINCAALPENLLESELFGYEEGAFTGARKGGKMGVFELAHGGTIFLDEIGSIPERLQMSLLRVLQEREVMRVGGERVVPVNVRVIAATNAKLEELVWADKFRADLYYRLNVLNLRIPPLRDREEDVFPLIQHFLRKYLASEANVHTVLSNRALHLLTQYEWPGNVRQLENLVERLCTVYEGKPLHESQVAKALDPEPTLETGILEIRRAIDSEDGVLGKAEKALIHRVLREVGGNRTEAARRLGISTTTLWRRLKAAGARQEPGPGA